ncbi:hypothetical protein Pla8534_47380 [Lignipirellula cremea]|uniref:Resolvase/invertase-type recombinase catalytic domain-containing protein n=1 Tax=Lignipirellula cremea TaxID=2528010 RepID=A0A518DYN7_9BACT|nr:hypothetical protein Pla8534_47380 [Lignipirellula cremea]
MSNSTKTATLTASRTVSDTIVSQTPPRPARSEKIAEHHLQRLAIVYVRQSTQQQVLEHRESTHVKRSQSARQPSRQIRTARAEKASNKLWPHGTAKSRTERKTRSWR